MRDFEAVLERRRVFVTGHSGFTGSWLCAWLTRIGANVYGYSLPAETEPALCDVLSLDQWVESELADIIDYDRLLASVRKFKPDVVIHLAAQPLVRRSYREPLKTFAVNTLGTAHVLEAARQVDSVRGVVCVTTDKVYENREWEWAYRENDPIGGKDPYSASKSAAEMVIKGYAHSFMGGPDGPVVATARGGNIVGGGDWSQDRLVPDFVRAIVAKEGMTLRFPDATRPWQHVLALVQAYLMLSAGMLSDAPRTYARAWNFGPKEANSYSVRDVMEILSRTWSRPDLVYLDNPLPEAGALALDSRLAIDRLGWVTPWSVPKMIEETARWYRAYYDLSSGTSRSADAMKDFTFDQIDAWRRDLASDASR